MAQPRPARSVLSGVHPTRPTAVADHIAIWPTRQGRIFLSWVFRRSAEQGCKDSNPVHEDWKLVALPGAHPYLFVRISQGVRRELNPAPRDSQSRMLPLHHEHHQQGRTEAEGAGVEPARLIARPRAPGGSRLQSGSPSVIENAGPASGPGWTRTTGFPHVKGTSSPLDDGTPSTRFNSHAMPRPGLEPGTPR